MARSAALNPASMPFFPGGFRANDGERGNGLNYGQHIFREQDPTLASIPPSDFRSIGSSPSPPQGRPQPSPGPRDNQSPSFRQQDTVKPFPNMDLRSVREGSLLGPLGTLAEREDLEGLSQEQEDEPAPENGQQPPGLSTYPIQQQPQPIERIPTLPFSVASLTGSVSGPFSSSPVSSLDSNSRATPAVDFQAQTFESQLRASPLIRDILDRLGRCEYTTQEVQRDLGDISRKVNLLVERALGVNSQPEFKDPFASNAASLNKPRPSIGNIAPNQATNVDDISSISQRLNTLTSSVGQLLALQTQQMQQSAITDARSNSIISLSGSQLEIAPNQTVPSASLSNSSLLGHGLPNRPDIRTAPRQPNPMRTWSAGNLDLPLRQPDQTMNRPESVFRDKRRSVSGLSRRDSSGIIDPQGDSWAGGSRDNGPTISKWEQLSLAPELLRSLGKFGVGPPNKIQQRALPFLLRGADIIAQAPPTQERIAAYVIPAIQVAVTNMSRPNRGPIVIMVSTTVDQATQAQRMIRDLGGPIGVKSALGVGATTTGSELTQELRLLQQSMPHIICGTPQKLHAFFTAPGGLIGSEVRFLVLDEVDQLIARNLHEFVFNIVKLLPPPRSRSLPASSTPTISSPIPGLPSTVPTTFTSPFEPGNPVIPPLQSTTSGQGGRRFSAVALNPSPLDSSTSTTSLASIERQTALFSNTVPQDVLNLASAIQLREPVRVLVRRDGGVSTPETSQSSRGLRQFYLYLAFTAGGRSDPATSTPGGLGIIGSGRSATSAETAQAREWKLDALADIFDDVEISQAVVYVGGMTALDSVMYKLANRGLEPIPLNGDMNVATRASALNKFRSTSSVGLRQANTKVLVIYDVQLKNNEVPHVPLVINYDLPKAVEEYSNRVSPAIASAYSRAGVVINFVTATGGDVEMLRSIECYYKIKCPEVPTSLRDIV